MNTVKIDCPITWYDQVEWIRKNCINWIDETNWAGWQIGINDIYFQLTDKDAIIFLLVWT